MIDQWEASVAKLIDLTRAGVVKWEKGNTVHAAGTAGLPGLGSKRFPQFDREELWGIPYFTFFAGKNLALYEARYPQGEEGQGPWACTALIEFISAIGKLELVWPERTQARELLGVVRHQTSGANDFLATLLATAVPASPIAPSVVVTRHPGAAQLILAAIGIIKNRPESHGAPLLAAFYGILSQGSAQTADTIAAAKGAMEVSLRKWGYDPKSPDHLLTLIDLVVVAQDAAYALGRTD